MSVAPVPAEHAAAGAVRAWCEWYTRGLPEPLASDRRDEVASDLHEHAAWAAEQGIAEGELVRGIRLRMLGGALDDLSWRRHQLRAHESEEATTLRRNARGGLPVLAYTLALLVLLASGLVVLRVLLGGGSGSAALHAQGAASAVLALAASACSLVLMARRRTRWVGALWVIVAVYCLVRYGTKALVSASATSSQLAYSAAAWDTFGKLLIVGLTLFFVGMAVRWAPSRREIDRGVRAVAQASAHVSAQASARVSAQASRAVEPLGTGREAVGG